jgi:hypothetical protein
MVIVVPAFAERNQGQEKIILAGIGGLVAARAEQMAQRIDREGAVPTEDRAEKEAPDEQGPSAKEPDHHAHGDGRDEVIFIQPAEFGKFSEITNVVETGIVVLVGDDPTNVRPEKAKERWRMQILFLVGETVVMAVMGGPPQNSLLYGGHGHKCDDELEDATGFIGAMREVAMVARGHEEHAQFVQREAGNWKIPVEGHEENQQRGEVHQYERKS